MKAKEAKDLFRELAEGFFTNYTVIFSNQSRIAKPSIPLVVLTFGNVKRPQAQNSFNENGVIVGYYQSRMTVIVDLFTNGEAVKDEYEQVVGYSDTAMDEILVFADYLNSPKCVAWCNENDVSILIETDAQNLTGVVNDNNYEYRSRLEVLLSFTQETDASNGDMGYISTVTL